jgi:hypothetical protein
MALNDAVWNLGERGTRRRAAWLGVHPDDAGRVAELGRALGTGRTGDRLYAAKVLDVLGRVGAKDPEPAVAQKPLSVREQVPASSPPPPPSSSQPAPAGAITPP